MKLSITSVAVKNKIRSVIITMLWILIWEILSQIIDQELFLPGPINVVKAFIQMAKTSVFWISMLHSIARIGVGFLLGLLFAIILGGFACKFGMLRDFLFPFISIIKSIPVASFIILILVWMNSNSLSIGIAFLVTFPIIYIAILEGYDHVNHELLEMTIVYQVKPWTRLRYLYVSEILPFVITGAKVAIGMGWKAGISGEIIGLPKNSIGEQLYLSKLYLDMRQLFAWTAVIVLCCYLFEKIFIAIIN